MRLHEVFEACVEYVAVEGVLGERSEDRFRQVSRSLRSSSPSPDGLPTSAGLAAAGDYDNRVLRPSEEGLRG